jgi:hypothetical protein
MAKKYLRVIPIHRKPTTSEPVVKRIDDGIPNLPLVPIMDVASKPKRPKSIDMRRKARHR